MNALFEFFRNTVTAITAISMIIAPIAPSVLPDEPLEGVETVRYVALGASNVNGFGIEGYMPEDVAADPVVLKAQGNVYGYQRKPADAYPAVIASELQSEGKNVILDQLAISSMRAEELRVLLDEDFEGDTYTSWRFTGRGGWFDNAGGIDALRAEYREKLTDADLITLDIGVNNFAVYASNRIQYNMYQGSDMATILPEADYEAYMSVYNTVLNMIASRLGEQVFAALPLDVLNNIVDTFAYALYGYCTSLDAIVGKIYEWNPDADLIVVSIQNLMHGLNLSYGDTVVPLGEIYGAIINMANLYASLLCPYADRYTYVLLSEDGHVSTFLDEIKDFDGTINSITKDMKDCFDIYDNNLYLKFRVRYIFMQELAKKGLVGSTVPMFSAEELLASESAFAQAHYNDMLTIAGVSAVMLLNAAENDLSLLPAAYQPYFAQYLACLDAAYIGIADCFRFGASSNTVDASALLGGNAGRIEKILLNDIMFPHLLACVNAAAAGQPLPEFGLPEQYDTPEVRSVFLMGVRNSIGNSFFVHPSVNGHRQIADRILEAYRRNETGEKAAVSALFGIIFNDRDFIYDAEYANAVVENTLEMLGIADAVKNAWNASPLGKAIDAVKEVVDAKLSEARANFMSREGAEAALARIDSAIDEIEYKLDEKIDLTRAVAETVVDVVGEVADTILTADVGEIAGNVYDKVIGDPVNKVADKVGGFAGVLISDVVAAARNGQVAAAKAWTGSLIERVKGKVLSALLAG